MSGYSHLTREERDRLAEFRSEGLGCNAIARRLVRSASTISRELRRNALESGWGRGCRSNLLSSRLWQVWA
jgi:IS30 family transposase